MLVLDCSSSLDDVFSTSQANAKNFIKTLYDASGNDPFTPNPPSFGDDETFTVNGVTFKMIKVEGGTYQMGSNNGDSDEKPVHSETVYSFQIGETEVTQGLWRAVMGTDPSYFDGNDNLPVEIVSWNDCQDFINRLNEITGKQFRLPSETEWEYAARGGNQSQGYTYSGGNNINDVAWYGGNSGSKTHPVAQKQPNELGIYDMSGNVWEWTSDWYSSDYSSPRNSSYRVYRGGSWNSTATSCRVANRSGLSPGGRGSNLGLRLAL
ncbi:MAG: formylglycine-generating enzyme family protein [Muribaculaceae bacterium]|nr:formylglycine-generating enzyme family protein [Muribaculaceae bacterium]